MECEAGGTALATGGESHEFDDAREAVRGFFVLLLHKCTVSVATEGVRNIDALNRVATLACPGAAKDGQGSHAHADTGGVLE